MFFFFGASRQTVQVHIFALVTIFLVQDVVCCVYCDILILKFNDMRRTKLRCLCLWQAQIVKILNMMNDFIYIKMPIKMGEYDDLVIEPIEIRLIRPSNFPVRYTDSNTEEMSTLKESIRRHGLLQPILIRPLEQGFEIVAGHRRFTACKSLHHRFISCRICEFSDKQAFEIQLSENLQRKSMDPLEEAEAYQKYVTEFGWGGIVDLSRRIGKSQEYISHRMQLLRLPDSVKGHVVSKSMNVSQALELVGEPRSEGLVDDIVQNRLTVKQIRSLKADKSDVRNVARRRRDTKSKETRITKRGIFALKIALSRFDDLVDASHDTDPRQRAALVSFMMDMRRQIHSMIDETIRFEKDRPKN